MEIRESDTSDDRCGKRIYEESRKYMNYFIEGLKGSGNSTLVQKLPR